MGSISKIKRTGLVAIGNAIASIEHRNLAGQIASYKREFKIARIWQMITDSLFIFGKASILYWTPQLSPSRY